VAEEATRAGHPRAWDVVETWLKDSGRNPGGRVRPRSINTPRLLGMQGNPGLA
jgi:sulfur-oxidizing protein SoxB